MLYGIIIQPHFAIPASVLTSIVPGSSEKMLSKSSSLAVDSVIYDLEDSVTVDSKAAARG